MKIIIKIKFHLFRKLVLKVKKTKYRTSGKNLLLVEDILMQQIQANRQPAYYACIIEGTELLKFFGFFNARGPR